MFKHKLTKYMVTLNKSALALFTINENSLLATKALARSSPT